MIELIKNEIENIKQRKCDERVVEFRDTKNKFIVPKSSVTVEVALKEGVIAKIDVTDLFKEVL